MSGFKLNSSKLRKIDKSVQRALEQTAEALRTEVISAQVMPFDEGDMQNNNTFVDYGNSGKGKVSIVVTSPQARRLYFHPEYNFQTINNPNAKGGWFDDWLPKGPNQAFAQNAFFAFLKRRV
ncbi:MAG: hypothetical protein RSC33_00285 [Vagococcus sp.]